MTITERTKIAREKYDDFKELMRASTLVFWREAEILYEFKTSKDYKFVFGEDTDDIGRNHQCTKCNKMFFEKDCKKKAGVLVCPLCGIETEYTPQSWRWFVDEIGVPLSTADYKTKTYRKWVVELQFAIEQLLPISTRKLHIAVPYATKDTARKILSQANSLSFNEFYEWLRETYKTYEKVV
jgi:hypothetical protein